MAHLLIELPRETFKAYHLAKVTVTVIVGGIPMAWVSTGRYIYNPEMPPGWRPEPVRNLLTDELPADKLPKLASKLQEYIPGLIVHEVTTAPCERARYFDPRLGPQLIDPAFLGIVRTFIRMVPAGTLSNG